MKVVILAGGLGTRISEETATKPKPMIEIGDKPIIWHIMKIYSTQGFNEFIICLGYKGYIIKEYFFNYFLHQSDVTIDIAKGNMHVHAVKSEDWKVTLINTGSDTMIGGRIKRILPYVKDDPCFALTYGDGVGDVDIPAVIRNHEQSGRLATVTAVQQPGRFGALAHDGVKITGFREKPMGDGGWINGGYFVLSPKVGDYIDGDETVWEREPMERLASEGQLGAYFHHGFWQPMDTLRDKRELDQLWQSQRAPWKIWKE